jgi:hypothetical protein
LVADEVGRLNGAVQQITYKQYMHTSQQTHDKEKSRRQVYTAAVPDRQEAPCRTPLQCHLIASQDSQQLCICELHQLHAVSGSLELLLLLLLVCPQHRAMRTVKPNLQAKITASTCLCRLGSAAW